MSLEASRHLGNAGVDPRRRTYAIGIYAHVLDRWGIIYDQPLVLHQRQAGAAIEGVVRQTAAANVERLAVDTHGYKAGKGPASRLAAPGRSRADRLSSALA
jgi:TnpA family transposase